MEHDWFSTALWLTLVDWRGARLIIAAMAGGGLVDGTGAIHTI